MTDGFAVVTGGAQGIGRRITQRLVADGLQVAVLDLPGAALDEAGQEPGVTALAADVTDEASVEAALQALGDTVRVLVNNAGVVEFHSLDDSPVEAFRRVLDVNLVGTFVVGRCAARRMSNGGRIVNLASINGIAPVPGTGSYGASKAGVEALTRQMALEWAHRGIQVNAVAPGLVFGGMARALYEDEEKRRTREAGIPGQRLASEDDIADAVAFLATGQSSYMTGQTIVVDGGLSLLSVAGSTGRA